VAEGEASDEILYVASNLKCDVIVMGTHGRTGLERLLTGSGAEAVLRAWQQQTARQLGLESTFRIRCFIPADDLANRRRTVNWTYPLLLGLFLARWAPGHV
jgi:hypothetical protein